MADLQNIASSAPAAKTPQPGFVADAAVLPSNPEHAELSNTIGDALAAFGVGGDIVKSQPVVKPKPKPKAGVAADPDPNADPDANPDPDADPDADASPAPSPDPNADLDPDADPDANPAPDADPDADADPEKAEEARSKRRERFANLTAKLQAKDGEIKTRDERIAELETQLETATTAKVAPTKAAPLADIEDEAALKQRVAAARQTQRWCLANPQGGRPPGAEQDVSPEEAQEWLAWSDSVLDTQEEHRQVLVQREANRAEAVKRYPTQFQNGHADAAIRSKLLKEIPGLSTHADRDLIIGRVLRAMAEEAQEQGGKGRFVFMPLQKGDAARPKPKAGSPAGSAPGTTGATANGNPPGQTQRTPVRSPDNDPKRKNWEAVERGVPVSAESLLLGSG